MNTEQEIAAEVSQYLQSQPLTQADFAAQHGPELEAGHRDVATQGPADGPQTRWLGELITNITAWIWHQVEPLVKQEICSAENYALLRLGQTRNALVRDARLGESAEAQAPQLFEQRLFAAVFDNEVQACLRSSQDTVRRQGARLRLRLHLTAVPELAALPWEYLYHAPLNRFLALSAETPLVRYLELPDLILPVAITAPLRLLVMIASPTDYPQLDVEQEWGPLKTALADLEQRGLLEIERVEDARLAVLQQRLRQRDYHILHFIGHGGFDAQRQEGVLLLEDQAARSYPVSGGDLGMLLYDHRSLRLVVLNACQGGRSAGTIPLRGWRSGWCNSACRRWWPCNLPSPTRPQLSLPRNFTARWLTVTRLMPR